MARRQAELPLSMTTLCTHDTKRSEDTRARISVLAELAREWQAALARLQELAPLPDGPLANLLWQAIAGAWPADRTGCSPTRRRRPARPATPPTGWTRTRPSRSSWHAAVDAAFDDPAVRAELESLVELLAPYGAVNSLGAKLVQLTMPGVPDVYQGTEFWDRSLTDPDNRRPFDYGARRAALAALDAGDRPASYTDDAAKLLVTSRALRLRRDRPELFTGYRPGRGHRAGRRAPARLRPRQRRGAGAVTLATRLPRGLEQQGGWQDTAVELRRGHGRRADRRHLRRRAPCGGRHPARLPGGPAGARRLALTETDGNGRMP